MTTHQSVRATVLGSVVTLTGLILFTVVGCSSTPGASGGHSSSTQIQPMAPGMTMPDGSIMGAGPPSPTSTAAAVSSKPSESAAMICTGEFRSDLAEALAVHSVPAGTATWRDDLYTCAYDLFGGRLVLSVKDLPTASATDTYFAASQAALPGARALNGLTAGAFGDGAARVVLRKDDHVLTVDASGMPAVFGAQNNKRADFAYEVAAVVLGCWTGD